MKNRAFIVATVLLFGCAIGLSGAITLLKLNLKKLPIEVPLKCSSLPAQTASWRQEGKDQIMKEEETETLGTLNYVSRVYVERNPPAGKVARGVQIHLAYYTGMVDTVPHVPDRCIVASGGKMAGGPWVVHVPLASKDAIWQEDAAASADTQKFLQMPGAKIYTMPVADPASVLNNRVRLPRGIDGLDLRVFDFTFPGSSTPTYSGYFFIANGGLTSLAQDVRMLAFDLKSDYAFYLKVQFTATQIKGPEELAQLAGSLLDELLPDIMLCVPDWTDVIRGDFPADNPRRLHK